MGESPRRQRQQCRCGGILQNSAGIFIGCELKRRFSIDLADSFQGLPKPLDGLLRAVDIACEHMNQALLDHLFSATAGSIAIDVDEAPELDLHAYPSPDEALHGVDVDVT